ncbi:MAG TPA: MMPL family transporter [Thermoanaerobaculia bacterium]
MNARARAFLALGFLALAGLAAAAASRVLKLDVRVHDLELLPTRAEVLDADRAVRDTFGSDERLIIAFAAHGRSVTDPVFLEDLRFFTRALGERFNIRMLLFDRLTHPRFHAAAVDGQPWLLHPPDGAWIGNALRSSAIAGKLASGTSRRTAFLETPAFSHAGVASIETRVREAFARLEARKPGEYEVRLIGRHVVLNGLGQALFEDLQRLLPWCFALIFVLFWGIFRSWRLAAIAILQSGLCVLFTLAVLESLGHSISLTTAMIPILVTVLGIADDLHLYSEYLRLRQRHPAEPAFSLVWKGVRKVFFPCTATTLTTAIGFASFLPTDVPALRIFGLLAGIGVVFSWLLTMTVVPALLALVPVTTPPAWTVRPDFAAPSLLFRGAVPVALSLLLLPGIARLEIDDGWTRNFRPDHPIVRDVRWFEKESVGVYQFDVMLTRNDNRGWTDPRSLRELERFQSLAGRSREISASLGLPDLVRDRAWELGEPAAQRPALPATRREAGALLATYRIFNEEIFLRMFLDPEDRSTRLILTTVRDDYATSSRARQAVDEALRRVFPAGVVEARIGGSAERGRVLIQSVVSSQGISVAVSLLLSWLTLGFASGRWGTALRCILAIVWALALVLGLAGWAGIPLGVASSCFLALGVGVGLDYGIHLAFGREKGAEGAVFLRVLANVLVVGAGLSLLMLSANPTIARLGLLIVLSMAASGYTAIVVFRGIETREPALSGSSDLEDAAGSLLAH